MQEFVHTKVSFFEIPQNNLNSGLIVGCLVEIDVAFVVNVDTQGCCLSISFDLWLNDVKLNDLILYHTTH